MAVAEFIVSFREFFEIFLLLGLMVAFLYKTGSSRYSRYVFLGGAVAVVASIGAGLAFNVFSVAFEENEELFEGVTLTIAAILVSWLVVWMLMQRNIVQRLHHGLKLHVDRNQRLGIAVFAFIAVFREGIELVLFLGGIFLSTGALSVAWCVAGAVAALALAYAFFRSIIHLNLSKFFTITSVILIFLAAGLLSQGVHELQEAGTINFLQEEAYNINPPLNADGSYPAMHDKGLVGGTLKGLVGYDGNPSVLQAIVYAAYLALMYAVFRRTQEARVSR